jgi:hypothetical protein
MLVFTSPTTVTVTPANLRDFRRPNVSCAQPTTTASDNVTWPDEPDLSGNNTNQWEDDSKCSKWTLKTAISIFSHHFVVRKMRTSAFQEAISSLFSNAAVPLILWGASKTARKDRTHLLVTRIL